MVANILTAHPIAERYPLIEGVEFNDVVASIRANGLRVPILRFEGRILDGRCRYRACLDLGIEPRFEDFTGTEAEAALLSDVLNLHRRHLTREQVRRVIAWKVKEDPNRSDRSIGAEVKADR